MTAQQTDSAFREHVRQAEALFSAGRLSDAATTYGNALALAPHHAGVLHNLGVIAARLGEHESAIGHFDAALALEPRYALAHYSRGVALEALGRTKEAIDAFSRALKLDPGNYAGHRAIAFCLLAMGERERALDHFARTYELRRGDDRIGIADESLQRANRTKLQHDAEQFRHLARTRRDAFFATLARSYESVCEDFPAEVRELSPSELDLLGDTYNTSITVAGAPEVPGRAVAERPDRDEILRAFEASTPGVAYFDQLLTERALLRLKRYLLESTIWHDFMHIEGFVASYLEDGLACPLLLQIIDELKSEFPGLLGPHRLTQAWAFKAVQPTGAIDVHGDDAEISVNFWLTADSANLNPGSGGMGVCLVPPPSDFAVGDYHRDRIAAARFLEEHRSGTLIVPYRQNRAVLFRSRLLHYSDIPEFDNSYESHRISVSLLFG